MKNEIGWKENHIFPGTHWLFYDARGRYRSRIYYSVSTNWFYLWQVMDELPSGPGVVGFEINLKSAKKAAELVMNKKVFQLRLL